MIEITRIMMRGTEDDTVEVTMTMKEMGNDEEVGVVGVEAEAEVKVEV